MHIQLFNLLSNLNIVFLCNILTFSITNTHVSKSNSPVFTSPEWQLFPTTTARLPNICVLLTIKNLIYFYYHQVRSCVYSKHTPSLRAASYNMSSKRADLRTCLAEYTIISREVSTILLRFENQNNLNTHLRQSSQPSYTLTCVVRCGFETVTKQPFLSSQFYRFV